MTKKELPRFIFLTGGVLSSLGKGIAASSIGALLQARGFKVKIKKLDPYLNVDPGTMSPYQHGEVYVTEDGAETDLDLGHYERFTGSYAHKKDSITAGAVYQDVLEKERRGDYLGGTVQVIPHVTNRIKEFILDQSSEYDFVLCEIGGTVGDIESLPFIESIRQLGNEVGRKHTMFVHLTLVPYIPSAGELKTKPTQHSVKELLGHGIQPDLLLCRSQYLLSQDDLNKLSLFCNLPKSRIITALDVESIYQVPLYFHQNKVDHEICQYFDCDKNEHIDMEKWQKFCQVLVDKKQSVSIAVVGKYMELKDAYKSLNEALIHAGVANHVSLDIDWIDADKVTAETVEELLKDKKAILVPGGFGIRGTEGMMTACRYAREYKVPFLGICYGLQLAIIDIARHKAGLHDAATSEWGPSSNPLIGFLKEWEKDGQTESRSQKDQMGGSMRLGAYPCLLKPGSLIESIYGSKTISERHRHRYEINLAYREALEKCGVVFSGISPDGRLPEIIEMKDHPWFVGVQFHPELKSKPFDPHPLFVAFIKESLKQGKS